MECMLLASTASYYAGKERDGFLALGSSEKRPNVIVKGSRTKYLTYLGFIEQVMCLMENMPATWPHAPVATETRLSLD